jgi:hypothetical protein
MFRSLLYDHPQGSSFVLSALSLLRLLTSSFTYSVCGCMPSMCMCVRCTCLWVVWSFMCPVYLSVGCLVVYVCPVYLSVGCLVVKGIENAS